MASIMASCARTNVFRLRAANALVAYADLADAMAHNFYSHGYKREHSNLKSLDSNEQTTVRAERAKTERQWKDTLLSSPGALSVGIESRHLFIADTNHHRIIIADADGKIVDCIGSSPGLEDGTFESARLCYPASTVFDEDRDYLYIADSENNVVRRADLMSRTVSTISLSKPENETSIWGRLLNWIGPPKRMESEQEPPVKAENCNILRHPWHLKFNQDGLLLVASRHFEDVWVLNSRSGEASELQVQGSERMSEEFCRKAIDWKEMEDVHSLILHDMKGSELTLEKQWQISKLTDIVSKIVRLDNKLLLMDTEGQVIRKYDLETGSHGTLNLSNLGFLGLPYWWSLPSLGFQSTACVNRSDKLAPPINGEAEKLRNLVQIQPGRCLITINPALPQGMVLAAPLEAGSVWLQARGSVVELSVFGGSLISHKISSAQQWIDDLDDLDDPNAATVELTLPPLSESGIPFYALLDASLGLGEVIIDAVLHLKCPASQESKGYLKLSDAQGAFRETVMQDKVFLKHLHTEVRLEIATNAPEDRKKHITVQL